MKYVLFYGAATDLNKARQLFAQHRAVWKEFQDRGELLMIGPFSDPSQGALGIFTTRESAEKFAGLDPFVREGVVVKWEIREWHEAIFPGA